ncbi:MAG: IS110 family transposase [Armatimonadota bacterium]
MVTRGSSSGKTKAVAVVNEIAAGIDVGSREHYVAVGKDRADNPVRRFGCYTPDLEEMATWLLECGVSTVAMESTGVYWIPVYQVLRSRGLDVSLVDARSVKNVPGRKSDVSDCQWLQQLHTFGLLRGCFLPDEEIAPLREYIRHRGSLIESQSREILHLQKSLEQMNLHVHKVFSDITGVSGMNIVRSIVRGERNAKVLAGMRAPGVKASEEEIVKALDGHYQQEHLFVLSQALATYDFVMDRIRECDQQIEEYLKRFENKADPESFVPSPGKPSKRRKNEPHFELDKELFRITGVDLTSIDGISNLTAQTIVGEVGFDLSRFPTEKHFVSWLQVCPNNQITGGKVRKRKSRKCANRVSTALRIAAQSLHSSKTALGAFYRRLRAKLGAPKAITATARKLACLVYRMLRFGMAYVDAGQQHYEQLYREQQLKRLKAQAEAQGYDLVYRNTGEVS